ncbi:hypothetical protein FOFC_16617 [Fusarium oxysporum]|nr:hypothetical protein FOFC_16617 [Fusarium oxysporum]
MSGTKQNDLFTSENGTSAADMCGGSHSEPR